MATEINEIYDFGRLTLDTKQRELSVDGKIVSLSNQRFNFLLYLMQNADRVVSKKELLENFWDDAFVEGTAIPRLVRELRSAIGECSILTFPKNGYRFNTKYFSLAADEILCPWMGLNAYNEKDASLFYGREKEIDNIVEKIKDSPVIVLLGHSGVGKTSLVNAGLIPRLKDEWRDIEEREDWRYISLQPNSDFLLNLSVEIASIRNPDISLSAELINPILNRLKNQPGIIIEELEKTPNLKLLFFIDQIEGIFSLSDEESITFVNFILQLSKLKNCMKGLIITLRDSFLPSFSKFEELDNLIWENFVRIPDLNKERLKDVIDKPPNNPKNKVILDEGLSDLIIRDIEVSTTTFRGILPLLSNFLVELFESREDNKIKLSHYYSIGSVTDSIERYANEVFDSLSAEEQPIAEKLFVLMADVGERPELDSCKQLAESKILGSFEFSEHENVKEVIHKLSEKRLLVILDDDKNSIELPHFSLIRNWKNIQNLLSAKREALRTLESISNQAKSWLEKGRNEENLLTGDRLARANHYYNDYKFYIDKGAREFFNASRAAKEKREKKILNDRRKQKISNFSLIGLGCLLIFAIILVLYYVKLSQKNLAAKLAANAQTELEKDPAKALDFAIQAAELDVTEDTIAILAAATASSHLRMTLRGHKGTLTSIAVSNDGHLLATSSRDTTARIWESKTGKLLQELKGHKKQIEWCSFSKDGKQVLTASSDGTTRIWEVATGLETKKIETGQKGVNNIEISPDGKSFLTAGEDGTSGVWKFDFSDVPRFILKHPQQNPKKIKGLNSAVFSPEGDLIATASGAGNNTAVIWNTVTREIIKTIEHPESVLSLAFSPDGTALATACKDGMVRIYDVGDWQLIREIKAHKGAANRVAFNSKGNRLVSTGLDMLAIIWDWKTGNSSLTLRGHKGAITGAVFSPDDQFLYTSSGDMEAKVWKIRDITSVDFKGHQGDVYEVAFSSDGEKLLTAGKDYAARLWEVKSRAMVKSFVHTSPVRSAKFNLNDNSMVTATEDGKIHFWNIETGSLIREFQAHNKSVYSLSLNPSGDLLASGDESGIVKIWKVPSGEMVDYFGQDNDIDDVAVTNIAFSPDGRMLAVSSQDRSVKFWNVDSRNPMTTWVIGTAYVNSVSFNKNDKVLVGSNDKSLRIRDLQPNYDTEFLLGHLEGVNHAEFSSDGKFIVSASSDDTVRIWSADLSRELYKIDNLAKREIDKDGKTENVIHYVTFSPNNKDVAYSDNFGAVKITSCPICNLDSDELIKYANSIRPQIIQEN